MPKMLNFGVRETSWRQPLLCSSLLKRIAMATNVHIKVEEVFGAVISNQSGTKLCKESQ
jgi:hypothetical protein